MGDCMDNEKYIFSFSVISPLDSTDMTVAREHYEQIETQLDFYLETFREFLVACGFASAEKARLKLIPEEN